MAVETSSSRPLIVGSDDGPSAPYPLQMEGPVIPGFGRGSKELGIPTANLPVDDALTPWISNVSSGIYFGWASLLLPLKHPDGGGDDNGGNDNTDNHIPLFPMVMSIGYNPFYKNTTRSAEVHLLHDFSADFYDCPMRLLLLDFIRPERGDYSGIEELVRDIRFDCEVARRSLDRPAWSPPKKAVAAGRDDGRLDPTWLLDVRGTKRLIRNDI